MAGMARYPDWVLRILEKMDAKFDNDNLSLEHYWNEERYLTLDQGSFVDSADPAELVGIDGGSLPALANPRRTGEGKGCDTLRFANREKDCPRSTPCGSDRGHISY